MFNECLLKLTHFAGGNTNVEKASAGVRLRRPRFNGNVQQWVNSPQYAPRLDQATVDFIDPHFYTWVGKSREMGHGRNER